MHISHSALLHQGCMRRAGATAVLRRQSSDGELPGDVCLVGEGGRSSTDAFTSR